MDTELQGSDYDQISEIFKNSGYSIAELKEIDLYEVFPLLQVNLLSVAGEWSGFDESCLHEKCEKNYHKRQKLLFRLVGELRTKYITG